MKLAVTAIALVLAASSSAGAADNWDQVIAAAKKEAAVTMYCNAGNADQLDAAAASRTTRAGSWSTAPIFRPGGSLQDLLKKATEVRDGRSREICRH